MIERTSRCRRRDGGFTLVELLVVIVILGILAAVVVFAVRGAGNESESVAFETDATTIRTAQEAFCAKKGHYATMTELVEEKFLSEPSTLNSTSPGPDGPCTASGRLDRSSFSITCDGSRTGCQEAEGPVMPLGNLVVGYDTNVPTHIGRFFPTTDIFDTLVHIDDNHQVQPHLAESWQLLVDTPRAGTDSYQFKIRRGVRFHDGTELTADDVVYSLNFYRDTPFLSTHDSVPTPGAATKVDAHTVNVEMLPNNKRFLEEIGHPQLGILKAGTNPTVAPSPTSHMGTGPFRLESYDAAAQRLVQVRFPDYWDTSNTAQLNSITFRWIPDENTRLAAFLAQEIHVVARISGRSIPGIGGTLAISEPGGVLALDLHSGTTDLFPSLLEDPTLRRAVSKAIDPAAIRSTVYGPSTVVPDPHPPGLFTGAPGVAIPAANPPQAAADLDAAGWTDTNGDGIRDKDTNGDLLREPLRLVYIHNLTPFNGGDTGVVLRDQLRAVGIDLQLGSTPLTPDSYDIIARRSFITEADPCFVYDFTLRSTRNNGRHSPGPGYDAMLDDCNVQTNIVTARAKAVDAAKYAIEGTAAAPVRIAVGTDTEIWGVSPRVQGFDAHPIQGTANWEDVSLAPAP